MSPSRALTRSAVLVLAAGTAACGVASVAPKVQLRDAVVAIADARSASFTLSLPSSADDVREFLVAAGEDGSAVDDAVLGEVLGTELAVAFDRGENTGDPADDAGSFAVRSDGEAWVEARTVAQVGYLRVDVPALTERFPEMADDVDSFRADLGTADLGELRPAADAALDGDWLSVDMGEGSWLAEQQEALAGAGPQLPEDFGRRLLDLAGRAMDASVSVRSAGEDDTGDRLVATANLRELYTNVADELPALLGEVAPGAEQSVPPASEVPDRDVSASFWVEDDELRRVELDLAQFLEEPAGSLVIRVDVADAEPIEAPDDAVEVDLEALFALTGATPEQLFGGMAGGPSGVGVEAAAIAVDHSFRTHAEMAGVAPTVEHLPMVAEEFAGPPPVELIAVGERVQVTFEGETACLTLGADAMTDGTVTPGPC